MRGSPRRTARGNWRGSPMPWSSSVLELARREVERAHGRVPDARFAVLGYGSLGGEELGFGSDLDLVFLYDAPPDAQSDGARPLDASRWFARLAQKIVALARHGDGAGRLYDVDVRLRPDGAKGLLVSSLASYADYQRERAWTWEHQALVRARGVAGDASLLDDFERVRSETLAPRARPDDAARRSHADAPAHARGTGSQRCGALRPQAGRGRVGRPGIPAAVARARARGAAHARWLGPRDTPGLAAPGVRGRRWSIAATCDALIAAHAALLEAGLRCTLDRRPRITAETDAIAEARARDPRGDARRRARRSPKWSTGQSPSRARTSRGDARGFAQAVRPSYGASASSKARTRPRACRASWKRCKRPRTRIAAEHEHRHARRAGFAEHVDRIGACTRCGRPMRAGRDRGCRCRRRPRCVGANQRRPGMSRALRAQGLRPRGRRAARGRREQAAAFLAQAGAQALQVARERSGVVLATCSLGPPSNSAVRGDASGARIEKSLRACASHRSSTGCRLPTRVTTLSPDSPSCSGATTTSHNAGVKRGSRTCTTRAPRSRRRRVASAAWRPQPIASARRRGEQGAKSRERVVAARPRARRDPAPRRRGASAMSRASAKPIAAASARACRTLPARPSLSVQHSAGGCVMSCVPPVRWVRSGRVCGRLTRDTLHCASCANCAPRHGPCPDARRQRLQADAARRIARPALPPGAHLQPLHRARSTTPRCTASTTC